MPANVIAFTVSGLRQKYLREALDSWSCARDVQDWHLLFALEPCRQNFPVAEFTQWAHRSFASAQVSVADQRLGCLRNTRRAMSLAFAAGAEFAVLAEEDLLVSTDVLEYFSWARDTYREQEKVTVVCGHSLRAQRGACGPDTVVRHSWFNPLAWGTWKDRWDRFIDPEWGPFEGNLESWDNNLRVKVATSGREAIFPVQSRSLHIGQTSTLTPGLLAEYFYKGALSSSFSQRRDPQAYREVPFTSVPGLVV